MRLPTTSVSTDCSATTWECTRRTGRVVPIYNWQYVDELFDFLQSIGMKPFVELGFMPSALASGKQTIFWYKANVTPPKD